MLNKPTDLGITFLLAVLMWASIAEGQDKSDFEIINQADVIEENGCNPSSISNFLLNGTDEMRNAFMTSPRLTGDSAIERTKSLISNYCDKESVVRNVEKDGNFVSRPRFLNGMSQFDTLPTLRDLQADGFPIPEMEDQLLIRGGTAAVRVEETDAEHLSRVHQILSRANSGVPVIAATWECSATRTKKDYKWETERSHVVTIVAVSKLSPGALGFEVTYLDSAGGERRVAYLHIAERPFRAERWSNSYTEEFKAKLWESYGADSLNQLTNKWKFPRPYLQLTSPSRQVHSSMALRKVNALTVAIYPRSLE